MIEAVAVPQTPAEVVDLLQGGATVLAGGTILMPEVNNTSTSIRQLVSTRRIGSDSITVTDGHVSLDATTTLAAVGAHPELGFLTETIESIASPTIRSMATVGGNLFALQPYGDLAVCFLALDATAGVLGTQGSRSVTVAELLAGGLAGGELVTSIEFDIPTDGTWFYTKAMRRKLNSASIATVAAVVVSVDGVVTSASVALGGAGTKAARSAGAEGALQGNPLSIESVEAAAAAATAETDFSSDAYASAWYRKRVLPVHFKRALLGTPTEEVG